MVLLFHVATRISQQKVKLENQEKEEELQTSLENLHRNFSKLMVVAQSALDHKLQHQQLVLVDFIRWIEHQMNWVGDLSDITDLNELFKKLHPYFDFIDCKLIVDMSEEFLNDECYGEDMKNLASKLTEHMVKAKSLRCSSTVKELKVQLKTIYSPYLTNLSNMPQIQIELHNPWNEATIEGLYLLIGHLLPYKSKQSILKYIEIETGSVRIKYIVYKSKADCFITYVQSKLQFMRLIGIFALTINGESIVKEDENMNFTFESALLEAAKVGHNEAVQFLLNLGVDVDHFNDEGSTALMIACEGGREQVVQSIVSAGANVNIQDNIGRTALMIASENSHTQVIKLLLKEDADINIQEEDGWTALMLACLNNYTQVAELLLKEEAGVNIQSKNGLTALMIASKYGHTKVVELLLKVDVDVNIQEKNGWTALMIASKNGHNQVAQLLLKENANVNIQAENGWTALMLASQNGHIQVVQLLVKELVDIDVKKKNGVTALMLASISGHLQVAECLLQSHADPHIKAYNGSTAFSLAAYSGNRDLVNMLLDKAEPTTDEIEKAVVTSCYSGHPTLITFLLNKLTHLTNDQRELLDSCVKGDLGAVIMKTLGSPDTPLVLGLTPLMVASSCGHVDIVDALIQTGANVNKQESLLGWTPLFFAIKGQSSLIVETLLMYGASPNVMTFTNETPLDLALNVCKTFEIDAISELLIKYGGQTTLKSLKRNRTEHKSSLQTSDELQTTPTSLETTHEATVIKTFKDKGDTIKRKTKQEISSFSAFIDLFI